MANLNGQEGQFPPEEDGNARANPLLAAAVEHNENADVNQRLQQVEQANATNIQRLDQIIEILLRMQLQPPQEGGAPPAAPCTAQANYLPNVQRINQLTPNNHSAQVLTPVATFTAQINYPPPGLNVGGPSTLHMGGTPLPNHYSAHVGMPAATLNAQDNHPSTWYNEEDRLDDEEDHLDDEIG